MIIAAIFILCLASAQIAGGDLRRLAHVRLRGGSVALGAVAVQVVVITIAPGGDHTLHAAVHIGTYAAAGWFVWMNRRFPFFRLVALGGVLNLAAIVVNGGVMPASHDALATAGLLPKDGDFYNSSALAHPHLLALGDIFAIPKGIPLANVFSFGDLIIAVAGLLLVHHVADSRLAVWLHAPGPSTDLGRELDAAAGRGWRPDYGDLRSVVADAVKASPRFYEDEIAPNWDRADRDRRRTQADAFSTLAREAQAYPETPEQIQALLTTKAAVLTWAVERDASPAASRSTGLRL